MDVNNDNTKEPKILLVDDNDSVRTTLSAVLAANNFRVTVAANVSEALHLIDEEAFDVLLCDLHMPGAGDGFTVVSAMRHTNPDAVTLVFTGYPALQEAMDAILLQADEILVKPMDVATITALIRTKLQKRGVRKSTNIERVASILERDNEATIARWLARVNLEPELTAVPLDDDRRTGTSPNCSRNSSGVCVHRGVWGRKRFRRLRPCTVKFGSRKAIRFPCWSRNPGFSRSASSKHCRRT